MSNFKTRETSYKLNCEWGKMKTKRDDFSLMLQSDAILILKFSAILVILIVK